MMRRTALAVLVQLVLLVTVSAAPVVARGGVDGSAGDRLPGGVDFARTGVHHADQVAAATPAAFTGNKEWVVLRCRYQQSWTGDNRRPVRNPKSYFNTMFSRAAPGLAHYWKTVSYGQISISTTVPGQENTWRALPHPNSAYGYQDNNPFPNTIHITASFDTLAADCAQVWDNAITFSASKYYAFTLDQTPGACGVGGAFNIGGKDGVQWALGTLIGDCQDDEALWTHEMGHAFGLQHSEDGDGGLYSTAYDIMSAPSGECGSWWDADGVNQPRVDRTIDFGCIPGQLMAYHKTKVLGWIPPARIYRANGGTKTIVLHRLAGPIPSNSSFLMAEIPLSSSSYYTIEARLKTGISDTLNTRYDENIPHDPLDGCCYEAGQTPPQGMIVINKITTDSVNGTRIVLQGTDDNGDWDWNDPGTNWVPGETFTAEGGKVKVEVISMTRMAIKVKITSPRLAGFNYYPLVHKRILNTQSGVGAPQAKLGPGGQLDLQVLGRGGIPSSGVGAVVLNLRAVGASARSSVTAWTKGLGRPNTANLQLVKNRKSNNLITVRPSADGKISLFNSAGSTHLLADVVGYYGSRAGGLGYNPLYPQSPNFGFYVQVNANSSSDFEIGGYGHVPATGVSAVALQVDLSGGSCTGSLTVYPKGSTKPALDDSAYNANEFHTTMLIVRVPANGYVTVHNGGSCQASVNLEILGWFGDAGLAFRPLIPKRVKAPTNVASGADLTVDLTGVGGVPASGALAVLTNMNVLSSNGIYANVRPADEAFNYGGRDLTAGTFDANAVLAKVAAGTGNVRVENDGGATKLAIDVFGWFGE